MSAEGGRGGLVGRHLRPLLDRRDATVYAMGEAIQDEVIEYRIFQSPDDEAEWAEGLASLLDLFLTLSTEDRWLTPAETHGIRAIGAQRADQGFSPAATRLSVRIAVRVARDRIIEEYDPTTDEDRGAMTAVLNLLDRFSSAVQDLLDEGYRDRRNERNARGGLTVAQLVHDVLDGALVDEAPFAERSRAAGCDAAVARAVFLSAGDVDLNRLADQLRVSDAACHVVGRSTPLAHGVVVAAVPIPAATEVLIAAVQDSAANAATTVLYLGTFQRPRDAHASYLGAVELVPHLPRIARGTGLVRSGDVVLHRFAAAIPGATRRALRQEVLRGLDALPPTKAAAAQEALACFVRHKFNITAVMSATGRNRKTVYMTRDQLELLLGMSLAEQEHQAVLALARLLHELET
ncbi:MAG TPA: hypothetical protein VM938_13600 [Acidimicrobiales bacterium]|nr:hypothetical protein [Acidimicrobiales bacterium]